MRQTFIIPGRLPGMNEYTAAQRYNRYKGAAMKREAQRLVAFCLRGLTPVEVPVRLCYTYYEKNRRRDLDNISGFAHKVVQDALVEKGILKGDGWRHVTGMTDVFAIDKDCPRIEVSIITEEA